jgi:hypothetical protein
MAATMGRIMEFAPMDESPPPADGLAAVAVSLAALYCAALDRRFCIQLLHILLRCCACISYVDLTSKHAERMQGGVRAGRQAFCQARFAPRLALLSGGLFYFASQFLDHGVQDSF